MVCHFHQGPHIYPVGDQSATRDIPKHLLCYAIADHERRRAESERSYNLFYGMDCLKLRNGHDSWDIGLDWIIYRISTHHKNKIREKKHMLGNPMEFTWLVLWVSFCLLLLLWIFCPTTTCPSCMYVWTLNARLLQKNIVEDSNRVYCCWNNHF